MTNYRKGYDIENRVVNILKGKGYNAVRSAGSHSPFDVFAWKKGEVRFIQVKRQLRKVSYAKEIKQIKKEKVPENVSKELWIWEIRKGWEILFIE